MAGGGKSESPALERLNAECLALYERMQGSVLRVQLPATSPLAGNGLANDARFDRYTKLNPDVKRQLAKQQQAYRNNLAVGRDGAGGYGGGNGLTNNGLATNGQSNNGPSTGAAKDAGDGPNDSAAAKSSAGKSDGVRPDNLRPDRSRGDGGNRSAKDAAKEEAANPVPATAGSVGEPRSRASQPQRPPTVDEQRESSPPREPSSQREPSPAVQQRQSVLPPPESQSPAGQQAPTVQQPMAGQQQAVEPSSGQLPNSPPPPRQYTLIVPPPQQVAGGGNYDAGAQQGQSLVVGNRANLPAGGVGAVGGKAAAEGFVGNQIGILLNDQGDVLVPTYVEREAVGDQLVKLAVGDGGEPIEARYVGADEQTQLTVLRCVRPAMARGEARIERFQDAKVPGVADAKGGKLSDAAVGKADANENRADAKAKVAAGPVAGLGTPVRLSRDRLVDGTLVLLISPADGTGRLTVWNNNGVREFGVVVTIDGRVAGVARGGQFLSGAACQLIADQIVQHGTVRRATLGVLITQVDPLDPARMKSVELGDRPAVRVDQVVKGSAAERGGVRVGDLILSVAGEPVHDIPSLSAAIAGRQGAADLKVLRDGAVVGLTVELVRR